MTVKEVITTICERNGITITRLAEKLGVSQSTVSNTLNNNEGMGMKVENLIKWLDELECQIVIEPYFDEDESLILDGEFELE